MKFLLVCLLIGLNLTTLGQAFIYPVIEPSGKGILEFIPKGWEIKKRALGDLNNDKLPDQVLVLQFNSIVTEQRSANYTNDGHPRILLVFMRDAHGYNLALQNNTIIQREGEGGMVNDALDTVFIDKGILNINYEFVRSHAYYKYRYQQNNFYLIGLEEAGVTAGNWESWSYNFLTKKAVHSLGKIDSEKSRTELKTIKVIQLNSLAEPFIPYTWNTY